MRFSIIVPVYNGEKFLSECLDSIASQTCDNYELIVVDDGSTDRSGDIANTFAASHKRTRVFHGPNIGLLLARRKGLTECHGDYVVFLDSDDTLVPGALARVSEVIDQTGADVVSFRLSRRSDCSRPDDPAAIAAGVYSGNTYHLVKDAVLRARFNNLCGKALRLACMDVDDTYERHNGLMLGEDLFQLLPVIGQSSSLVRINDPLYYYRPNDSSSTGTYKCSYLTDSEVVARRVLDYGARWHMEDAAVDGVLTLYVNVLRLLVRFGDGDTIRFELPHVAESLRRLPCDMRGGVKRQRPDIRILLEGALAGNRRRVTLIVRATDMARALAGHR